MSVDVMVAAGGTGGHVYPAIAVAQALGEHGVRREAVRFVTDGRSRSMTAIADAGFAFDTIALEHGLERSFTLANGRVLSGTFRSVVRCRRLLSTYRPKVVVGFGAYVALPLTIAARMRGIPIVIHEQNAAPGLANRIAVKLGARAAVSMAGTPLARAVVTGNPVRPEVTSVVRAPTSPPTIAFVGGSLGSAVLDDLALDLYAAWRDRRDIAIVHVTGDRSFEQCGERLAALRTPNDALSYELLRYETDMASRYRTTTIMVTRAGGMVAELSAAGMPAVLIPWPGATERHQHANAAAMVAAGAAVMHDEHECDAAVLSATLDRLLDDQSALVAMSHAAREFSRRDAAFAVAHLVVSAMRSDER